MQKNILKCMHSGYLIRFQHPHQINAKRFPGGAWSGQRFSYDNEKAPAQLVDPVDDYRETQFFPLDPGYDLEADDIITGVQDWSYVYCLTEKGRDLAISLFGAPDVPLYVRSA